MTETRQDRVQVALHALLPEGYTWTEHCDPAWLAEFPCGIAPIFERTLNVQVCRAQILRVGAHLTDWDFESLLDALITWVGVTMVEFFKGTPLEQIVSEFSVNEPVSWIVLSEAASRRGMSLLTFLWSPPSVAI